MSSKDTRTAASASSVAAVVDRHAGSDAHRLERSARPGPAAAVRRSAAAQRPAGDHRAGARRALGRRGHLGRRSARETRPRGRRRRALPGAPAVQGHRAAHGGGRSPRRSTRSAVSSTRSRRKSTPATTRTCSTTTCRWPSTWSATWCSTRSAPSKDMETERSVVLEEIAMRDDDPEDLLHEAFCAALLGRSPAGPPGAGHRGVHQRDEPRARCAASTGSATRRPPWSWRWPATSSTAQVLAVGPQGFGRPAHRRDTPVAAARSGTARGAGARWSCAPTTPSRRT